MSIQDNGLQYTSRQWQNSETAAFVKLLPEDVKIYSNIGVNLQFLTGKPTEPTPEKYNTHTMEVNSLYNEEVDSMCKDIQEKRALLVYFTQNTSTYRATLEELMSTCMLPVLHRYADGIVFGEISK